MKIEKTKSSITLSDMTEEELDFVEDLIAFMESEYSPFKNTSDDNMHPAL
jgi:DNA replication initiation complex subunit (GINS family)